MTDGDQEYGIILESPDQPDYVIAVMEGDPKKIIKEAMREYDHLSDDEKLTSSVSVALKTDAGFGHRIWRKGKAHA